MKPDKVAWTNHRKGKSGETMMLRRPPKWKLQDNYLLEEDRVFSYYLSVVYWCPLQWIQHCLRLGTLTLSLGFTHPVPSEMVLICPYCKFLFWTPHLAIVHLRFVEKLNAWSHTLFSFLPYFCSLFLINPIIAVYLPWNRLFIVFNFSYWT